MTQQDVFTIWRDIPFDFKENYQRFLTRAERQEAIENAYLKSVIGDDEYYKRGYSSEQESPPSRDDILFAYLIKKEKGGTPLGALLSEWSDLTLEHVHKGSSFQTSGSTWLSRCKARHPELNSMSFGERAQCLSRLRNEECEL